MDKWDRLLGEKNVLVGVKSTRNFDAIRELAAVFEDEPAVFDSKRFVSDLIRREQQSSTGIGKGVAVPHVHDDSIERQLLAIGISHNGIDFNSIDGEPVYIMALLATPRKHHDQHMELLATLSRLLQHDGFRQQLIESKDAADVVALFKNSKPA